MQSLCLKSDFFNFLQNIGSFCVFKVSMENLPPGARVNFLLVNERNERRDLDYVITDGVFRVFYTLFIPGSYRIVFQVNGVQKLAVSLEGLSMSRFFLVSKNLSLKYLTYHFLQFNYSILRA